MALQTTLARRVVARGGPRHARLVAGADVAFEVTGHQVAVSTVTNVVRVWGTVSIVAIHAEPMRVDLYQMFAREITLHGSRLYTRGAWEEAIELAASGAVTGGGGASPSMTVTGSSKI